MECFRIHYDYIGEFYYRTRKEQPAQSREDALYGLFNESADDSDEDDHNSRRIRKRRTGDSSTQPGHLFKPVNFITTGEVTPSEEVATDYHRRSGLKQLSAGRPGLGFETNDDDAEDNLLSSAFGRRIQEAAERRRHGREKEKKTASSSQGRASTFGAQQDVADFEKYTRGIGSKLLEKMGYKGGGLGKDEQGIAVPLMATLRPKNMGIGFNGYTENATNTGVKQLKVQVEQIEEVKPKEKAWLKKYLGRHKGVKVADDVLSEKDKLDIKPIVLDPRGHQARVLAHLKHLNADHSDTEDELPMPELQHNVRLIVEIVEVDLQKDSKKLQYAKELVVHLQKERARLQTEANVQKHQIETLEKILSILGEVQTGTVQSLDSLASVFRKLRQDYPEDFKLHNLSLVALSFALPLMVREFQGWEPLHQPLQGTHLLSMWHGLLQEDESLDYSDVSAAVVFSGVTSPYVQLVMEAVFPHIHCAAINTWEPRDPEPMLRILEVWEKFLPSWIVQSILEHLVLPKLTTAVDAWDPRRETIAIHVWLHPWLPMLGKRMEPLYYPICSKLCDALRAWHPSDGSVYALLSPWQKVLGPQTWEHLLVRSIVPKLMGALQELVINPREHQLHQFTWVAAWFKAVPIGHLIALLEAGFFPKWHQVLYLWLSSNPDLGEVARWYGTWRSLFTDELVANERIKSQLLIALDMMNQAAELTPIVCPRSRERVSYEERWFETQQPIYAQQQPETSSRAELSLKEVVVYFAEQNDVQFLPKVGHSFEGHQVYGFGSTSVCIDNAKQRIFYHAGDKWVAGSLEELLAMHHAQLKRHM